MSTKPHVSLLNGQNFSKMQTRQQQKRHKPVVSTSKFKRANQPPGRCQRRKYAKLIEELRKEVKPLHLQVAGCHTHKTARDAAMSDSVSETSERKQNPAVDSSSKRYARSLLKTPVTSSDKTAAAGGKSPAASDISADVKIFKSLLTGNIYVEKSCPQKANTGKGRPQLGDAPKKVGPSSTVTTLVESRTRIDMKAESSSRMQDSGMVSLSARDASLTLPRTRNSHVDGYRISQVPDVTVESVDKMLAHGSPEMRKKHTSEKHCDTLDCGGVTDAVPQPVLIIPQLDAKSSGDAEDGEGSGSSEAPNSEVGNHRKQSKTMGAGKAQLPGIKVTSSPLETGKTEGTSRLHIRKESSKLCSKGVSNVNQNWKDVSRHHIKAEETRPKRLYRSLLSGTLTEVTTDPGAKCHVHPAGMPSHSAMKGSGIISDKEDMKDAMLSLVQQKQWNSSLRHFTYLDKSHQAETAFTFHLEGQGSESEIKYVDVLRCGASARENQQAELNGSKATNAPSFKPKPGVEQSVQGSSKSSTLPSPRERLASACGVTLSKPKTSKLELICQNLWKAKGNNHDVRKEIHSETSSNNKAFCKNWRCKKRSVKRKSRKKYVAMREEKGFHSTPVCRYHGPETAETVDENSDENTLESDACGESSQAGDNEQPIDLSMNKTQLCYEVPFTSYR